MGHNSHNRNLSHNDNINEWVMTEREMFEKSFQRPTNYFELDAQERWDIDKRLGILDWCGEGLTAEDIKRFEDHYVKSKNDRNFGN